MTVLLGSTLCYNGAIKLSSGWLISNRFKVTVLRLLFAGHLLKNLCNAKFRPKNDVYRPKVSQFKGFGLL